MFLFFIGFIASLSFLTAEPLDFKIKGESALLMNAESGRILFEKEGHIPRYPASTTKLATALYALKIGQNNLDENIFVEGSPLVKMTEEEKKKLNYFGVSHRLEPDGSSIKLQVGEVFSLRDLIRGMLICSGNDASNVIAHRLGPTIPVFIENMNAYLKEIGCKNTHFCNPHGLHDPAHQTTAFDLALMLKEALKHPEFCTIVSQTRFHRPKTVKQGETVLLQTNRLLRPGTFFYSKAIGGKTGYHSKAKKTFVCAARHNGRTLIVVLLGYPDGATLFKEAIDLFETAFNQPKVRRVYMSKGPQTFALHLEKTKNPIQTYLLEDLFVDYYSAEDPQAKCYLVWDELVPPVAQGDRVGELRLVGLNGEILQIGTLHAQNSVELKWLYTLSWWVWGLIFLTIFGVISLFFRIIGKTK